MLDTPVVSRYRGDFVAWTGGCGFIGEGGGGPISPHSHYAIQLAIGAPAGLRVQFGRHGEWQSCAAALIPSRATHSIDVNACDMSAVLFVEPETPEAKLSPRGCRAGSRCSMPTWWRSVPSAWSGPGASSRATTLSRRCASSW